MAYIQKDRVKETTTTTGTGPLTLAGAVIGFQAFSAVMSVADTCYYVIVSATGTDWETGTGTYSAASVLTRTTVLSSSNSGNAVSFASGVKDVFMGPIAGSVNDIAHGGTGATTAAQARTNLGVSTGTVTSVSGTGTVSGLTLTGTVTAAGSLVLGGAIATLNQNTTGNAATVTTNANLTGHITSVGNAAVLGAFSSAQLAGALSDETGTGAAVFATSPTLVTPLSNALSAVPVASGLTASITAATGASGTITYTCANTFTAGRAVSVTGLTTASGTSLNIAGMTIATASSTQFTVANTTVGTSSGTGTATAGGNALTLSASNAVTAGPGGDFVITAGSGVGVGAGGNVVIQLGSQGSSGGNGKLAIRHPSGVKAVEFYTNNGDPNLYLTGYLDVSNGLNSANVTVTYYIDTSYVRLNSSSYNAPTAIHMTNVGRIDWSSGSTNATNTGDTSLGRAAAGVVKVSLGAVSTTTGGSLSFPSSTTNVTTSVNDLALPASAFQRLNCTTASSITGIAPPSGSHTDGRMVRVYNVGTVNLTLTHNSGSSAWANRFWNKTAADIVLGVNDYAELIYDSTSNGSGNAGWRVR